jgi:anti-sigma regulatory factor (Ser/Thr protein kinase)
MLLVPDLAELARLRRVAQPFLEECGASARTVYRTSLALEELVSNVVRHARGARGIAVGITIEGEGVVVVIEDDGPEFDVRTAPLPDTSGPLERRPTGGLGIHLLRHMTDDLRYERAGEWNRVVVRIGM